MKLNLYIIADELNADGSVVYAQGSTALTFSELRPFSPEEAVVEEAAYVVDAKDLTAAHGRPAVGDWVCCGIPDREALEALEANVLILPHERLCDTLLLALNQLCLRYANWGNDLVGNALAGVEYQQVISGCALKMLRNPFLLFNPSDLCVSAVGDLPDDFDNAEWLSLVESVRSNVPASGFKMTARAEANEEPLVFERSERYSLLVTNIFVNKTRYGKIVFCDTQRPFTKGFISLASYFCDFMSMLTARALATGKIGGQASNFFIEILWGRHLDDAWFERHARMIGIRPDQKMRVLVSSNEDEMPSASALAHIRSTMQKRFPQDVSFVYQSAVVTILFEGDCSLMAEEMARRLEEAAPHDDQITGISMAFYDLHHLKFYYKQALSALARLRSEQLPGTAGPRLCFYDSDCFFHDFLSYYKIDRDFRWLIHPRVYRLYENDLASSTNNVEYLKVFIECGCNIKQAAATLYVHYNTFLYRLERIKEIAEIDIRDHTALKNELFHLLLSCKLLLDQRKGR